MARENGNTTKWKTLQNEEDDDDEDRVPNNSMTTNMEALDDDADELEQMQEGRRVLGLSMAPPNKHSDSILSPGALRRVICTSILACVICILLGALIGYLATSRAHPTSLGCAPSKENETSLFPSSTTTTPSSTSATISTPATTPCPTQSTTTTTTLPSTTLPPITTITTSNTTTTQSPKKSYPRENLTSLAISMLSHLSPKLIRDYIKNITSIPADNLKNVIISTLENLGYTIHPIALNSMKSMSQSSAPNTVEIVFHNNSTKIVNNATHSLIGLSPFSSWSPNGTFSGKLVYAHYGRPEDFQILKNRNIDLSNRILLVRNCKLHPGVQVRNAENAGASAVILYPEPIDFRGNSPETIVYPDANVLPMDGIIMKNLRFIPGDPSTPNLPSSQYSYRLPEKNYTGVPSILVQPVSSETGRTLLSLLGGPEAPTEWKGSLVDKYFLGGEFKKDENVIDVKVTINNFITKEVSSTVVLASLPTEGASLTVHIGCRYESKGDNLTSSGLGLATLLALADAYKNTFPNGTERQVVFSTYEAIDGDFSSGNEFAEMYSSWLESTAMAYLDLDTVFEGKGFVEANVSPLLRNIVREALNLVSWPEGEGLNVHQGITAALVDNTKLSSENATGSFQIGFDFSNPYECDEAVNFHAMHGIPTVQLTSVNFDKNAAFALRDSQYDTIEALVKFEDKDLHWTHMIASVMGVVSLALSTLPLPPVRFDAVAYDLQNGWNLFLEETRSRTDESQSVIQDLLGAIGPELDKLVLTLGSHDSWYNEGKDFEINGENQKELHNRVMSILQVPRRFLRPRGARPSDIFGFLLTYGPDPLTICDGTYFPFLAKALLDVKNNVTDSENILYEELSYVYSSIYALNLDIPLRDT